MRKKTWGGDIFQSAVQGIARDVLVDAGLRAERCGYPQIFSVHDELVSEAPKGFSTQENYDGLMCELPGWAFGLPVNAEGWIGTRYRKG